MSKNSVYALLFIGLQVAYCARPQPQSHRSTLQLVAEIQGYSCAKGYAWFFADGRLHRCTVVRQTKFGEARIPAGSIIAIHPDGTPDSGMEQEAGSDKEFQSQSNGTSIRSTPLARNLAGGQSSQISNQ